MLVESCGGNRFLGFTIEQKVQSMLLVFNSFNLQAFDMDFALRVVLDTNSGSSFWVSRFV
jgi:hypothetical protein